MYIPLSSKKQNIKFVPLSSQTEIQREELFKQAEHQAKYEANIAQTEKSLQTIQNPSVWEQIKGTVKGLPKAIGQVATEFATHPIQTAKSIFVGVGEAGTDIANIATYPGRFFQEKIFGIPMEETAFPSVKETLGQWLSTNIIKKPQSEVQQAIQTASEQMAGYEIGGAIVKPLKAPKLLKNVLGFVAGGQIVTEAETAKDRIKQAAFDAAFGLGTGLIGAAAKGIKTKITTGKFTTPKIEAPLTPPVQPVIKPEPQIKYIPKTSLGTDISGERILARTEVDARTGNAIVYYSKGLEKNPTLKDQVFNHELGHIADKRLTGTNLSSQLSNYQGNKSSLDLVLESYSQKTGKSVEQLAMEMNDDISVLSRGGKNQAEKFANAFKEYAKNPEGAKRVAPTLSDFFEYQPVIKSIPRFSENVLTKSKLAIPVKTEPLIKPEKPKTSVGLKEEAPLVAGTGLKTGKTVKTKSFNPKSINAPKEVEDLFTELSGGEKEFATQRISKTNEGIKDLARLTGLKEEQLIKVQAGSIANAETTTAARQLVLDKASDLMNKLNEVDISVATNEQLKELKDNFIRLVSMQKSVAGLRTEASNVFRSFGIELAPGENATLKELMGKLKEAGIASEGDLSLFSNKVAKQTTLTNFRKSGEIALATWYAAILSGIKTTVRNLLSTGSNVLTELEAKMSNPRQWNEVIPTVSGYLKAIGEGWKEAGEVLRGAPSTGKFMETGMKTGADVFTGKLVKYGKVVESVGRFLNAQDKFFVTVSKRGEEAGLKAWAKKYDIKITAEISDAISKSYGESTAYHGLPKGRFIQGIRDSAQALRKKFPESKVVIPFVDTVANVLDRQFDYLPVFSALRLKNSVLSTQAKKIIKDFGLKASDEAVIIQRLRDNQIGRLFLGTLVSTGAVALAFDGRISGSGPTNYDEKQQLQLSGWRPNSIKVGNTWIPYNYLGPLAGIFSMAGNIYDKTHYDNASNKTVYDLMGKGLVGWAQTQLDQSFLSGIANLFDVISGNTNIKSYGINFISGLVPIPALYSQTKDMIFRQQYETSSIVDRIRQKLGLTGDVFGLEELQPKLDAFGEPLTPDLIYGISPSKENGDRVYNFLIANDLVVTKPHKNQSYTIPGKKEKRALTEQEYTDYVQQSGKEIYSAINRNMDRISYMKDEDKKKFLSSTVEKIRDRIRNQIMR